MTGRTDGVSALYKPQALDKPPRNERASISQPGLELVVCFAGLVAGKPDCAQHRRASAGSLLMCSRCLPEIRFHKRHPSKCARCCGSTGSPRWKRNAPPECGGGNRQPVRRCWRWARMARLLPWNCRTAGYAARVIVFRLSGFRRCGSGRAGLQVGVRTPGTVKPSKNPGKQIPRCAGMTTASPVTPPALCIVEQQCAVASTYWHGSTREQRPQQQSA